MRDTNWQATSSVFLIGLGIGIGLGVLFAPKAGDEMRDDIVAAARDGVETARTQMNKVSPMAHDRLEDVKDQVREAADAGTETYRQAKAAIA